MNEIASAFPFPGEAAPDRPAGCQVLLSGIEVVADIGALAAEHGVRQPLRIDVALTLVPPARDDLSQTFDYAVIRTHALELAGQRINLIETFAHRLARMCLACNLVVEAQVQVCKPWAVPGCMAATRVRLGRH